MKLVQLIVIFCVCLYRDWAEESMLQETPEEYNVDLQDSSTPVNLRHVQILTKFLDQGKTSQASEYFQSLPLETKGDDLLQLCYGRLLVQLNRPQEGERIFREGLQRNSESVEARLLLGKLYLKQLKYDQSEKYILEALHRNPTNGRALALHGSLFLQRDSNINSARVLIERAAKYAPDDPQIQFDLGMVRFMDDDAEAGRSAFLRAEELNPELDLVTIGRVYLHQRHFIWAEETFLKEILRRQKTGVKVDSTLLMLLAETK
jgi:tetratricopeptide (TPR) repeat protein